MRASFPLASYSETLIVIHVIKTFDPRYNDGLKRLLLAFPFKYIGFGATLVNIITVR